MPRPRFPTPALTAATVLLSLILVRVSGRTAGIPAAAQPILTVTVQRVLDGDTFDCTDGRRVRLLGIDAPELAHGEQRAERWAAESRTWLEDRIAGQQVSLKLQRHPDPYGRSLAWVYDHSGELLNQQLLKHGMARLEADFGLPPELEPALRAAEAEARVLRLGIWQPRTRAQAR